MNTASITEKEFRYWQSEITRKGFQIHSETCPYNKNSIDYYINVEDEIKDSQKTYVLSTYKNGVGKKFYYKNVDIIGGVE